MISRGFTSFDDIDVKYFFPEFEPANKLQCRESESRRASKLNDESDSVVMTYKSPSCLFDCKLHPP